MRLVKVEMKSSFYFIFVCVAGYSSARLETLTKMSFENVYLYYLFYVILIFKNVNI